jgi:hypothetical protein
LGQGYLYLLLVHITYFFIYLTTYVLDMHQKLSLSISIAPLKLPTDSLRFHHGFLRKNTTNFD